MIDAAQILEDKRWLAKAVYGGMPRYLLLVLLLDLCPSCSLLFLQERDHIGIKPPVSEEGVVVPSRIQVQPRLRHPLRHLGEEVRRIVAILPAAYEQGRS